MKYVDVIIVGAGIAGMTAGIYAKRAGKSVLILESNICGGQIVSSLRVDNWPGEYGISGADLSEKVYIQVNKIGAEVEYEQVVKVEEIASNERDGAEARFEVVTDENDYVCHSLIIAVGTEPRRLSKKQAKDAGERPISYCATCDGALYEGKPVVVVGSGNTAKHEIAYLEKIASRVYHIHHDDPSPEDAEAVFVAIGRVPNTGFLKEFVEMDKEGYIVAGEDCKTSREGVYAVGDCRTKKLRQLVTASADGAMATANLK